MSRYATIVADPPWIYSEGSQGWGKRRPLPYETMTLEAIKALPVASLLEREGYLFMWTTNRYLERAFEVVRAWGCTPKQTLTWCKVPMGNGHGGMFATTTEFVIVAQNIREGTNAHGSRTNRDRVNTSWFQWPRSRHSQKPTAFMDIVQRVAPGPYLELFARTNRLGWDAWGNECASVDLPLCADGGVTAGETV